MAAPSVPSRIAHSPAVGTLEKIESSVTKVTVEVEDNNVEKAIREWKKQVKRSGFIYDLKRRRQFESNTAKRLRKEKESMKR